MLYFVDQPKQNECIALPLPLKWWSITSFISVPNLHLTAYYVGKLKLLHTSHGPHLDFSYTGVQPQVETDMENVWSLRCNQTWPAYVYNINCCILKKLAVVTNPTVLRQIAKFISFTIAKEFEQFTELPQSSSALCFCFPSIPSRELIACYSVPGWAMPVTPLPSKNEVSFQ